MPRLWGKKGRPPTCLKLGYLSQPAQGAFACGAGHLAAGPEAAERGLYQRRPGEAH